MLTVFVFIILIPSLLHAQWSSTMKLSQHSMNATLNENAGSCLVVSGDTIHVVWSDHRTNGYAIYYERSADNGLTWNTAMAITDTTGKASMPAIAVSGSSVHVVWMDSIGGIRVSYYKRSLDGGNTWGTNVLLDNNTAFWPGIAAYGSHLYATLNKEVATGNTEVFVVRSFDNGNTWQPEQQISNAPGRSEDPAIAVQKANVYLSWNDNRSGVMEIYYIHSADNGTTWGPETPLTYSNSYSSMVCLNGTNVDIPYGNSGAGNFDIFFRESTDGGMTFDSSKQLTYDLLGEAYPYLVRDSLEMHMVYMQFSTPLGGYYLHSADGGNTWDSALFIGNGNQPFIAYSGCVLHVIWPDSGAIYYKRNPTGNCGNPAGVANNINNGSQGFSLIVYPNPAVSSFTVSLKNQTFDMEITDETGLNIYNATNIAEKTEINCENLAKGIYFIRAISDKGTVYSRKMIILK